jgi:thioredoxin 2
MAKVKIECQFCARLNAIDLVKHDKGPKCAECGKPFHLGRPVKVSEKHFDATVTRSQVPVLVDFYADWCAPCRQMAPFLDEIAREKVGHLLVAKVDTDAAPGVSQRYGIRSIPYFARFERGKIVKDVVGAVGRGGLQALAR